MPHLNPSAPHATRYPEDENCPGYGGNNKTNTYKPARICGSSPSDVPSTYRGGFGAPADFKVANFGSGGATGAAIPAYARASPVIDEVIGAVEAGANTFRYLKVIFCLLKLFSPPLSLSFFFLSAFLSLCLPQSTNTAVLSQSPLPDRVRRSACPPLSVCPFFPLRLPIMWALNY